MEKKKYQSRKHIIQSGLLMFVVTFILWLLPYDRWFKGDRAKDTSAPRDSQTLQVGADLTPADFGIDSLGHLSGKQVEWVEAIFGKDSVEWHPFAHRDEAIEALRNGKIDLYAASIPLATTKELEDLKPTEWLFQMEYALLYAATTKESWEELQADSEKKIEIAYAESDPMAGMLLENLQELSYPNLHTLPQKKSPEECVLSLKRGEIKYVLCSADLAQALSERDSSLKTMDKITLAMPQVWLLRAEDSLRIKQINAAILKERAKREAL